MRIVVCEDEQASRTAIEQAIRRWQTSSGHSDVELLSFASSEDLLEQLMRMSEIDLLFMDIQIPGELNGIELARRIREKHLDMTIIFCTNYSEYVYEGYTVNALRYLKKPINDKDIFFCCSYVYNRQGIKNDQAITVVSGGKRIVLRYAEIRSIEARRHTLYFSTTVSAEPLRINASLSDIQSNLPKDIFVLCHRSYIVNVIHIRMLTRTDCVLSSGDVIPISRTYSDDVNRVFDHYHQGGGARYDLDGI